MSNTSASTYKTNLNRLRANDDFVSVVQAAERELAEPNAANPLYLHEVRAEALYELGRYRESLSSFAYLLSKNPKSAKRSFVQKANVAAVNILDRTERKKFWRDCTDIRSWGFVDAKERLLDGEVDRAKEGFESAIRRVAPDREIAKTWESALSLMADAFGGRRSQEPPEVAPVKKIIVSGMGWSGSGALFDYFQEFATVTCTVKSEHRYIERSSGLLSVYRALIQGTDWRKPFLDFLLTSVLGFNEVLSAGDFNVMKQARSFTLDVRNGGAFARAVEQSMLRAAHFISCEENERLKRFREFASDFVDRVASGAYLSDADFYLLDNCVHIQSIEAMEFLRNTAIFAVFRDPRSNFVALRRENPSYREGVAGFIREKGKQYQSNSRLVGELSHQVVHSSNLVVRVQFERFVFDRQYRQNLAGRVGLDLSEQNEYQWFKPWESRKNVFIHESWECREDITEIEHALWEYCVDLSVWEEKDGT